MKVRWSLILFVLPGVTLWFSVRYANAEIAIQEAVINTKHNLSATWNPMLEDKRVIKAVDGPAGTTAVCVFCHTPHAAINDIPLWNRQLSPGQTYSLYAPQITYRIPRPINDEYWKTHKGSLDANVMQPQGYSKLCLSCHDGTIAIGAVWNAPGSGLGEVLAGSDKNEKIKMQTRSDPQSPVWITGIDVMMPEGATGEFSGDTRRIGVNLSNDHPVSFLFDADLEMDDTELVIPYDGVEANDKSTWNRKGTSEPGVRRYPLGFTGTFPDDYKYVQCTSCHNPHLAEPGMFLRDNMYNVGYPDPGNPNVKEQICLDCHAKPGWLASTHRTSTLGFNTGTGFEGNTLGQVGCLNCHDPHTVQGADRLHRNGASNRNGTGTPAIENTCFQCHIEDDKIIPVALGTRLVNTPADKEIKEHFDKYDPQRDGDLGENPGSAMPLATNWESDYADGSTNGFHQPVFVSKGRKIWQGPGDQDRFGEPTLFDPAYPEEVHVECVDCHNPHEVRDPAELIDGNDMTPDTNGGRLEGMAGISIDGYEVGRNARGIEGERDRDPYVHEVCFRCHGDTYYKVMPYIARGAYEESGSTPPPDSRPVNTVDRIKDRGHHPNYGSWEQRGASNKRREFDPGSLGWTFYDAGVDIDGRYGNYERARNIPYNPSFHPVASPGRNGTVALCKQLKDAFDLDCTGPVAARISLSNLTINCTDCHNNDETGCTDSDVAGLAECPSAPYRGPVTESNLRQGQQNGIPDTDKSSNYLNTGDEGAVGPHGSANYRILRAPYSTAIPPFNSSAVPAQEYGFAALCFLCHDSGPFLGGSGVGNTNFGGGTGFGQWTDNLHFYHINRGRLGMGSANAICHECHNNVHSNVEANNTMYGDGLGTIYIPGENNCPNGCLPPEETSLNSGIPHADGDGIIDGVSSTHLINFAPNIIEGAGGFPPRWFYDSASGTIRCQVKCHGVEMNSCAYNHGIGSSGGGCIRS